MQQSGMEDLTFGLAEAPPDLLGATGTARALRFFRAFVLHLMSGSEV